MIVIAENSRGYISASDATLSLHMLSFGYFNTIIYPQKLWTSEYINNINFCRPNPGDIFRDINNEISYTNKYFYLELPFTWQIYNFNWSKLLLLKNIKVIGIYLNVIKFKTEQILFYQINESANMLKRIINNFPIEKILFYSEKKWTEIPSFLEAINREDLGKYLSIFEYRHVKE
jgi:hypothetical protein